jgi:lysyl-tRNA synthetase class 1
MPYQVPFRHLCNLLQINGGDIDAVIARLGDVRADQEGRLRTRAQCAWYWITQCAPDEFRFELQESAVDSPLLRTIRDTILPQMDSLDEKQLSTALYSAAADVGLDPKALFAALYQALIGKDQGPRLANFMKTIGRERLERILADR